jgi:hypothetical protein
MRLDPSRPTQFVSATKEQFADGRVIIVFNPLIVSLFPASDGAAVQATVKGPEQSISG